MLDEFVCEIREPIERVEKNENEEGGEIAQQRKVVDGSLPLSIERFSWAFSDFNILFVFIDSEGINVDEGSTWEIWCS